MERFIAAGALVGSQRDAEKADIDLEKRELAGQPRAELNELAMIYAKRGLKIARGSVVPRGVQRPAR